MEGLADKVNQLLSDPEQLSQILSLAQSFGLSPSAAQAPQSEEKPESPLPDETMLLQIAGLLSQAQQSGGREAAVFKALKPFVSPARGEKMDRAAEIAKLSHLAQYALRSFGDKK